MTAIAQLEESVGKIATVFTPNPKQNVVNATYGASQKIWQNKADFDSKIPPVAKAIADVKGKIKDVASLKAAYTAINDKCTDCHETVSASSSSSSWKPAAAGRSQTSRVGTIERPPRDFELARELSVPGFLQS